MIDIHSHILPGVDDGAKDLAMSLEMGRQYVENGYTKVIATPHWIEYGGTTLKKTNQEVLKRLRLAFQEEQIPLELYLGNEFFITPNLTTYLNKEEGASLNDSKYVLVEFSMTEYPPYLESALYNLQLKGHVPIIAHPERYQYFAEDPNKLGALIKKGMLAQMNLPSLKGQYGKEIQVTAKLLLEHQMIHLVGTDAHSTRTRSPQVSDTIEKLREYVSEAEIDQMTTIRPQAILDNEDFTVEEPIEYLKKKKWYQFW